MPTKIVGRSRRRSGNVTYNFNRKGELTSTTTRGINGVTTTSYSSGSGRTGTKSTVKVGTNLWSVTDDSKSRRKSRKNEFAEYAKFFALLGISKSRKSAKPKNTSQSRTNSYKPAPRTSGQPYIPTAVLEFHSIKMPEDLSTIDRDLCIDIHNKTVNYIKWMKNENDPSYKETIEELSEVIVGLEIEFPDYFPEETALREKKLKKEQEKLKKQEEQKRLHEEHIKYVNSISIEDKFKYVKNMSVRFWQVVLVFLIIQHNSNIINYLWLSAVAYFIGYFLTQSYYRAEFTKEQKKKLYWFPVKWALIIGPIYTVLDYAYFVFFEYK